MKVITVNILLPEVVVALTVGKFMVAGVIAETVSMGWGYYSHSLQGLPWNVPCCCSSTRLLLWQ